MTLRASILLLLVSLAVHLRAQCIIPSSLTASVEVYVSTGSSRASSAAAAVLTEGGHVCWLYTVSATNTLQQTFPTINYIQSGEAGGQWIRTLDAPAQLGSCYSATLTASGGVWSQTTDDGPECWQGPPEPDDPPGGGDDQEHAPQEPLILDINGDGIWTTSIDESPVWFDLNANGIPDLTAWTAPDHEDGLLYADWNRNRTIDGGRELFGDATILPDGRRATHGYDALAAFDEPRFGGNGDHVISRADRIWPRLRIWIDRDHDGLATQAENYTLAEIGVVELALVYVSMGANESFGADRNGNLHMLQGHFLARIRGELRTHAMHEVYFRTVPH